MPQGSKVFVPCRSLGYVSNHIPVHVRYIKSRKENLIVTCVGRSFHTYGISHFGLLNVGGLHPEDITAMTVDTYHVYTACDKKIYAWRRGNELKHVYTGHRKPIQLMLPFGPHLVSIDESSNVRVWDIKSEAVYLELTFSNDTFQITAVVHPSTYINKILLGSDQGEMQLWNISSAKMIYAFKGWKSAITCLEQAPAVDVVAVGLANGRIILHNLKFDETIMEFRQDWGVVTSISFRTDGNPIMTTGSIAGHVVCWNLEERRVASQLLHAHNGSVTGMVCLPNEPLLLTSSPDNTLKLWIFDSVDGGARLLRIREGHAAPPSYIRFHGPNGHNILSCASDSTLRIFNTQTEQFNKSLGKASYNRKASKKRGRTAEDPLIMPPIVQFASESTREKEWDNIAAVHLGLPVVTTWSYDRLKMGDLKLLPECFRKKNIDSNQAVAASCVCLTSCGNYAIIGYTTGHIYRFNLQSGICRGAYGTPKAHDSSVRGVTTDSLNQLVISGGSDCKIKFWKLKSKGTNPLSVLTLEEPISFFSAHHERSMFAVALEDFDVYIVDVDTRRIVRKFAGHTAQITDATFSPDARWLVTSSMDCSIRTWDIPSAKLVDQFSTEVACVSLNLSPTGEVLATAHVDYLGIYLWTNRTLYAKVALTALCPSDKPELVSFPECVVEQQEIEEENDVELEFVSPEQISQDLITLSGLALSRWQNLLNLDVIKKRNKPKAPPKAPKMAPFFLPTISNLNFQFDLTQPDTGAKTKLLMPSSLINLTNLGRMLDSTREIEDFEAIVDKLKTYSPSMIDFEIKSLAPDSGGSVEVMLQFVKCIEFMLKSNKDFELAQMYFGVFLKSHGMVIAQHETLRNYLTNIQSCHDVAWTRLREKMLYNICVVQSLKR